jgi:hypothetical protein
VCGGARRAPNALRRLGYRLRTCTVPPTAQRALESSNVDTVIVFRSASPLVVAIGDYFLLGRAAPSTRSFFAMLLVFVGSAAFVATDAEYKMRGLGAYAWNFAYLFFISAEMLLGKQITAAHQVRACVCQGRMRGWQGAPGVCVRVSRQDAVVAGRARCERAWGVGGACPPAAST